MIPFEDIKIFLPKYLSPNSEKNLFKGLKDFPENMDDRLYTSSRKEDDIIFQGDGFKELLVINFPAPDTKKAPSMILSNTCDINPENKRFAESNVCYAPIFKVKKYKKQLIEKGEEFEKVNNHIDAIMRQSISEIFYLPKNNMLEEDSFVFFSKIISSPTKYMPKKDLKSVRIFTLSDYGLYLFLFKLSIHFTRIQEGVDRGN